MNGFRDWFFRQVHTKNLVYNTCWEDPRCDRELLNLDANSEMVMITSAGCNALDYLLDNPAAIHCVDMNPRQNALLELKLAIFKHGSFEDLFELFGQGKHHDPKALYKDILRANLPDFAQKYWDKNMNFFNGKGIRKTFYHHGTSGTFAWMVNGYLKARKNLYQKVQQLFEAQSLDKQASLYYEIEQVIINGVIEWLVNRHLTMSLVGVPRSQQELFVNNYDRGALGYIQESLRRVFTELPTQDNYFWKVYLSGSYSPTCCPSYLEQTNFDSIKSKASHIDTNTTTISEFLKSNPGQYSHYVLLDHQDWLAANNRPALEEEWDLILKNSRPGTRILLRSAAQEVDFFPDFVLDRVYFDQEASQASHTKDRVGTYASVYLGIVS
ncbi:MAG TPA: BtaA family protein [Saprospiraceae bacterium]|nr:BtaA family protein [Saprospiraceae bacterium]HMQ85034.1 BtaA family protein [Saprospiraceae bacterium]